MFSRLSRRGEQPSTPPPEQEAVEKEEEEEEEEKVPTKRGGHRAVRAVVRGKYSETTDTATQHQEVPEKKKRPKGQPPEPPPPPIQTRRIVKNWGTSSHRPMRTTLTLDRAKGVTHLDATLIPGDQGTDSAGISITAGEEDGLGANIKKVFAEFLGHMRYFDFSQTQANRPLASHVTTEITPASPIGAVGTLKPSPTRPILDLRVTKFEGRGTVRMTTGPIGASLEVTTGDASAARRKARIPVASDLREDFSEEEEE